MRGHPGEEDIGGEMKDSVLSESGDRAIHG